MTPPALSGSCRPSLHASGPAGALHGKRRGCSGHQPEHIHRDIESYKADVLKFEEMFCETTEPDACDRPQKVAT